MGTLTKVAVADKWAGLASVAVKKSTRTDKKTGVESHEKRYDITSIQTDAKQLWTSIRDHWSVESSTFRQAPAPNITSRETEQNHLKTTQSETQTHCQNKQNREKHN